MVEANGTCLAPKPMKATSNGLFEGDNPLHYSLPLIILQICLVVVLTRLIAFGLRPLRQPRVIAEIIGGILLGPTALGRNKAYLQAVFPAKSLTVLDTVANLGLIFFMFLVGLELDMKAIRRTGKKSLAIALAGISLPFALGIGTSFVLRATISKGVSEAPFLVFMGVALSITAFPVLARILAELKLLTTDVGRMAMSAAAVNDVAAWILLALAIALSGSTSSPLVTLWVFLAGAGFVIACLIVIPRVFRWIQHRCSEGESVNEIYVCATLIIVLMASFLTDMIGIHALFGAFVVGILVPKDGAFASVLVEKVEDLVSGLFLPLYFVSSGLKTDVTTIRGARSWGLLALVITTACFGKIMGTVVVSLFCGVHFQEALVLGFLMNTKGLVELIVLNIGKDRKVLNDQTFAIMVLMALFTTFVTTPMVTAVYKPAKRKDRADYKHRTIKRANPNTQMRILACFHTIRNIPTMVNLIEASRGKEKKQPLCVYALHLMELSERSSAILMVNKARRNGLPFWNKGQYESGDQVVVAFEAFQKLSSVQIRPMTAISRLHDMHEDICNSADKQAVAMIILPYHKQPRLDGALETVRAEHRWVNKKVLDNAPCSVGILVDRGLGGSTHVAASNVSSTMTVLFFGGLDDCEALAYGLRMAEHPGIQVNVIRFIAGSSFSIDHSKIEINDESDPQIEEEEASFIEEVKSSVTADGAMRFSEKRVKNAGEVMDAIREFHSCQMFVVGRMPKGHVAASLNYRVDCSELGPLANILISNEINTSASVLVVKHYSTTVPAGNSFRGSKRVLVEVREDDEDLDV